MSDDIAFVGKMQVVFKRLPTLLYSLLLFPLLSIFNLFSSEIF